MEKLISIKEAAEMLNVARQRIYYLTMDGQLPTVKVDRKNFYKESDIKQFKTRKDEKKYAKDRRTATNEINI